MLEHLDEVLMKLFPPETFSQSHSQRDLSSLGVYTGTSRARPDRHAMYSHPYSSAQASGSAGMAPGRVPLSSLSPPHLNLGFCGSDPIQLVSVDSI